MTGSLTLLATQATTGVTYTDTTPLERTTYYYAVTAYNGDGDGTQSDEGSDTTETTYLPPGITQSFNEYVTIEPFSTYGNDAEPSYGTAIHAEAYIEYEDRDTKNTEGEEVLSTVTITLDGHVTVTAKDRITLPDATTVLPVALKEVTGLRGGTVLYKEVLC